MLEVGAPGAKALQNPLLGLGTGIKPVFEIRVGLLSPQAGYSASPDLNPSCSKGFHK